MIPVLLYHHIANKNFGGGKRLFVLRENKNDVKYSSFAEQMEHLGEHKFEVIGISKIIQQSMNREKLKRHSVAITFDDGYESFLLNAYPFFKKSNYEVTIFVIVDKIGKARFLTWEQLRMLNKEGIDIQSHTLSHHPLEIQSEKEILKELVISKQILEEKLSKKIEYISFPQGSYNSKIIEMARQVGYLGCLTSDIKLFDEEEKYEYKLGRIPILGTYDINIFKEIAVGNNNRIARMYRFSRIKNKIKRIIGIKRYLRFYSRFYRIEDSIY